jgi:hypothetical protein
MRKRKKNICVLYVWSDQKKLFSFLVVWNQFYSNCEETFLLFVWLVVVEGHFHVCAKCAEYLIDCPLCRRKINNKIRALWKGIRFCCLNLKKRLKFNKCCLLKHLSRRKTSRTILFEISNIRQHHFFNFKFLSVVWILTQPVSCICWLIFVVLFNKNFSLVTFLSRFLCSRVFVSLVLNLSCVFYPFITFKCSFISISFLQYIVLINEATIQFN